MGSVGIQLRFIHIFFFLDTHNVCYNIYHHSIRGGFYGQKEMDHLYYYIISSRFADGLSVQLEF